MLVSTAIGMVLKAGAHTAASLWQRDQLLPLAVIATLAPPIFTKLVPYLAQSRSRAVAPSQLRKKNTCRRSARAAASLIASAR
ncbi:hypothetical protein VB151_12525 [Xanthomonas fragariae]|nr:hypothetical protein [Xanthomonas fragariae]MEA5174519.1 hypothetical protein [Xanthomonas fragariae]MEA5199096.1 hypothetical protein [Xanthomonas fragariae]MEA5211361.1 hypothetical protein [Xanthomonas fragariae]MEA5219834.1 hypothetical protein [Xanthomonas fragariae]